MSIMSKGNRVKSKLIQNGRGPWCLLCKSSISCKWAEKYNKYEEEKITEFDPEQKQNKYLELQEQKKEEQKKQQIKQIERKLLEQKIRNACTANQACKEGWRQYVYKLINVLSWQISCQTQEGPAMQRLFNSCVSVCVCVCPSVCVSVCSLNFSLTHSSSMLWLRDLGIQGLGDQGIRGLGD